MLFCVFCSSVVVSVLLALCSGKRESELVFVFSPPNVCGCVFLIPEMTDKKTF